MHLRVVGDERLVARIRAGDERAFEHVYDRYHGQLLAFCRHMLGSREEAEDALQRVFVSAHRQLTRDDRPIRLKPWLYAIARNRCLSVLRARADEAELESEPSTDGLAVAAEVERRQELRDILEDLRRLPDDQRAALVLAELGDLSHSDIATALDVRPEKVKALIFQAREALAGWREAREADCREIREQLATLRGSALRRRPLRRHVAVCAGCAAFEAEVARQRQALALVLPIAPSLALKQAVLGAALGGGEGVAGGGAAAAGGVAAAGGAGLATKAAAVVAIVAGAGGGGAVAVRQLDHHSPARVDVQAVRPAAAPAADPASTPSPASLVAPRAQPGHHASAPRKARSHAKHDVAKHGTPRRPATPSGLARRPTAKGAGQRPAAPPGQSHRPTVAPGTTHRPATPSGVGRRDAAPGSAPRPLPGSVRRAGAPGAVNRAAAPGTPPVPVSSPESPPTNLEPPGALKKP
jgi:RNA polymerase sigma factor (sigma-70 family)